MSYCRWIEGDVYAFDNVAGCGTCMLCTLHDGETTDFQTRTAMLAHLKNHQAAGDYVPPRAFEQLQEDIKEEGDEYTPYQPHLDEIESLKKTMEKMRDDNS